MKLQASCKLEYGYINLPISVLKMYTDNDFPLYFKITGNSGMNIIISVKDFIADENIIEIPKWLSIYLDVHNGEFIDVEKTKPPLSCNYIKLEPQEEELFNINDYDKYLEKELSNFSTLKIDSIFNITINHKNYHFKVLELEPDWFYINDSKYNNDINCLSIINIDLNVDIHNKFELYNKKLLDNIESKTDDIIYDKTEEKYEYKIADKTELRLKRLKYFDKKK
jgi:hypothetical protein